MYGGMLQFWVSSVGTETIACILQTSKGGNEGERNALSGDGKRMGEEEGIPDHRNIPVLFLHPLLFVLFPHHAHSVCQKLVHFPSLSLSLSLSLWKEGQGEEGWNEDSKFMCTPPFPCT